MQILVIDKHQEFRSTLSARVAEAVRQAGLRGCAIQEVDLLELESHVREFEDVIGFLGPGCYDNIEHAMALFHSVYPTSPVALVLENTVYPSVALELRRETNIRVMPLADIVQMAQFVLDYEARLAGDDTRQRSRGVIGVAQLKGGVGATTVAVSLASCWARNGLSVALVDLDDISPSVTDWAKVPTGKKKALSEMLAAGSVPVFRVNELFHQVEGFDKRLAVVPQPERYQESFHYKADVLDSVPSCAEFVRSLLTTLEQIFDVVVIDLGRSWGIATFAALPRCRSVLLVTGDGSDCVERSVANLSRLHRESDDPEEFDLARWRLVVNGYGGDRLLAEEVFAKFEAADLLLGADLAVISHATRGVDWATTDKSFYDLTDAATGQLYSELAFSLVPFHRRVSGGESVASRMVRQLHRFIGL